MANPFDNLAFPQSSMAARQATQPAPAAPAQPTQAQRFRTAYFNALANPDMPIESQFSTGSAKTDAQAVARARAARMLAAGQAAVAERAQAQGRLMGTDPNTGAPIVGDAPASPIVQESPGGVRVAYRNGMPVGFSTPGPAAQRPVTPTALMPQESAAVRQEATRLAAEQSVARDRAMQEMRRAAEFYKGTRKAEELEKTITDLDSRLNRLMAAGAGAAPAVMPVPARPTPFPSAPFRDASGRVDTAAVAEAQGRIPSAARQPSAAAPAPTEAELEEAVTEATLAEEAALNQATEQRMQMATEQFDRQLALLTRQIADATRRGDATSIRRLRDEINRVRNQRLAVVEPAIIDVGSPMF